MLDIAVAENLVYGALLAVLLAPGIPGDAREVFDSPAASVSDHGSTP